MISQRISLLIACNPPEIVDHNSFGRGSYFEPFWDHLNGIIGGKLNQSYAKTRILWDSAWHTKNLLIFLEAFDLDEFKKSEKSLIELKRETTQYFCARVSLEPSLSQAYKVFRNSKILRSEGS